MNPEINCLATRFTIVDKPVEANLGNRGKYNLLALALKNLDRTKALRLTPDDLHVFQLKHNEKKSWQAFRTGVTLAAKKVGVKAGMCVTGGIVHVYTR